MNRCAFLNEGAWQEGLFMGFKWFDEGSRVPIPSELWLENLRTERVYPIPGGHAISGPGIDEKAPPPRPPLPPEEKVYEKTEELSHERKPALRARQIMTSPVVALSPETTLEKAWELIRDHRFRHVPVLSREKKLVGIISDRDILREAARIGDIITPPKDEGPREEGTVCRLMKTKVLTAGPNTQIREIARAMFMERIGAMPIVDDHDTLVGIITRSDILRALITHAPLELWV